MLVDRANQSGLHMASKAKSKLAKCFNSISARDTNRSDADSFLSEQPRESNQKVHTRNKSSFELTKMISNLYPDTLHIDPYHDLKHVDSYAGDKSNINRVLHSRHNSNPLTCKPSFNEDSV